MNWMIVAQTVAQMDDGMMVESHQVSYLTWMLQSLGWLYLFLILGSGLALFLGAVIVVACCRRPAVIAAFLVFVPAPLLFGVLGTFDGMIRSYSVIAHSSIVPNPSDMAAGYSMALFAGLAGLIATLPGYFVLAIGLLLRTIAWRGDDNVSARMP